MNSIAGIIINILSFLGRFTLSVLYGPKNYDGGRDDKKLFVYSAITFMMLLFSIARFSILLVYLAVLIGIGVYNRLNKKTSFTKHGNFFALEHIALFSPTVRHTYLMENAPRSIVEFCEDHHGYDLTVYQHLDKAIDTNLITVKCAEILWERYNSAADPTAFPKIDFNALKDDTQKSETPKSTDPAPTANTPYACTSITLLHDRSYGKCVQCLKSTTVTRARITDNNGTREIPVCNSCYQAFMRNAHTSGD